MTLAKELNRICHCASCDAPSLSRRVLACEGRPVAAPEMDRSTLFSSASVYLDIEDYQSMVSTVEKIESMLLSSGRLSKVLSDLDGRLPGAGTGAGQGLCWGHWPGNRGIFMGYDFHLTEDGPRLIEINTNAGGAFLVAELLEAQQPCKCAAPVPERGDFLLSGQGLKERIVAMFRNEAVLAGRPHPKCIAIVDEEPEQQYLYPDFLLCRDLLLQQGMDAMVCPPQSLHWDGKQLRLGERVIDFVYNRLTDFYLVSSHLVPLRLAWLAGAITLSPHPAIYAALADKQRLIEVASCGGLSTIPSAQRVLPAMSDALWAERKSLFFKPMTGFGSKGAYRGAKMTRRVFDDILGADYIAQGYAPPGERTVRVGGELIQLKYDVRLYTHEAKVLGAVARLYQGQTTNFRTSGGGFAPVVLVSGAV